MTPDDREQFVVRRYGADSEVAIVLQEGAIGYFGDFVILIERRHEYEARARELKEWRTGARTMTRSE
jgi:hypothetical protein